MFSLPIVSAGMGFPWAVACLLLTWVCMLHAGLLILEVNLHYPAGSSFDTFIGSTLGPKWNLLNNLSFLFVLYILSYAFISGGGSIVSHSLGRVFAIDLPQAPSGALFALMIAACVWLSTKAVGRLCTVLLAAMILTFVYSISQLAAGIEPDLLLETRVEYGVFALATLPVYLTSFGFHSSIPSLVKYYGKEPAVILQAIIGGSLAALTVYIVWLATTLGQLTRADMEEVVRQGANIGPMVEAMSRQSDNSLVLTALNAFANFAVISSFMGAALGLFDFIADKMKFADTPQGRLQTAFLTFAPPTLASLLFPNGFVYAIGFAGLAATILATIVPSQAARVSRQQFSSPVFRVWGGNPLLLCVLAYGVLIAVCHVLGLVGALPVH